MAGSRSRATRLRRRWLPFTGPSAVTATTWPPRRSSVRLARGLKQSSVRSVGGCMRASRGLGLGAGTDELRESGAPWPCRAIAA